MATIPLSNIDREAVAAAIEADAGKEIPGLLDSLAQAQASMRAIRESAAGAAEQRTVVSSVQIQHLYRMYHEVLAFEVGTLGLPATETRHLIGRLGEFFCAIEVGGTLARNPNEPGFDVLGPTGRRISVKSTAQRDGFVSISKSTAGKADDLMVLQYQGGNLHKLFHGPMAFAVEGLREWKGAYELDLSVARKRAIAFSTQEQVTAMTTPTPRQEFEEALLPFCTQYCLEPVWYSDELLCLEPVQASRFPKLCVNFDAGYWAVYTQRDNFIRERARENVVGQLVIYKVEWLGQYAQQVNGSLAALSPIS